MLDIKFIRENPELVQQVLNKRQDSAPLDEILQLDTERRQKVGKLDSLRQERKAISREREKAQEKGRDLRIMIRDMEEESRRLDEKLEELLLQVPNVAHPSVPVGRDENDNRCSKVQGQ